MPSCGPQAQRTLMRQPALNASPRVSIDTKTNHARGVEVLSILPLRVSRYGGLQTLPTFTRTARQCALPSATQRGNSASRIPVWRAAWTHRECRRDCRLPALHPSRTYFWWCNPWLRRCTPVVHASGKIAPPRLPLGKATAFESVNFYSDLAYCERARPRPTALLPVLVWRSFVGLSLVSERAPRLCHHQIQRAGLVVRGLLR